MEYKLKREDLPNELFAKTLEVLCHAYGEMGADVYVVGAAARDIGLKLLQAGNPPRRTFDLDTAIRLNQWREYDALAQTLLGKGFEKAPEKQRFYYCPEKDGPKYEIDIVPFGPIAPNEVVAWPPDGHPVMSVRCFSEVMQAADVVHVDGLFHFRIASLSGQWLIKLDTWNDRHYQTSKDASDMQFLLENAYIAFALSSDTLPGEVSIDAEHFDLTVAGAEWIASDLVRILSEENRIAYANMLEKEFMQKESSALLNDLFDKAKKSTFDSLCRALGRMAQILRAGVTQ